MKYGSPIVRPLVPLTVSFILGLVFSRKFYPSYEIIVLFLIVSLFLLLIAIVRNWKVRFELALPAFFFLGAFFIQPFLYEDLQPGHIKDFTGGESPLRAEGTVYGSPQFSSSGIIFYVDVEGVFIDGKRIPAAGKIALTVMSRDMDGRVGGIREIRRGDAVRFVARLKEIKNFGNPGGYDYEWKFRAQDIYVRGYVKDGLILKIRGGRGFLSGADGLRNAIRGFIDSSGAENKGIIKALIIGDRGGVPAFIEDAFRKTGTNHILAISGLHVGFVAYFAYAVFFWIFKRSERLILSISVKHLALSLSFLPVVFYGLISGFSFSTQRAVIMVGTVVFSALAGRVRELLNIVALAALLILVISPAALWDISFELSFAAVVSIICLVPGIEEMFGSSGKPNEGAGILEKFKITLILEKLKASFFVTTAATVGTYPLVAYYFNMVSLSSFLANLAAVPLASLAVILGFVSVLVFPLWNGLALIFIKGADLAISSMTGVIKVFSAMPYSSLWVSTPTIFEIAVFYAFILCAMKIKNKKVLVAVLVFLSAAFFSERVFYTGHHALSAKNNPQELAVTFISVGQGDSSLVELPGGKRMLIDGGGSFASSDFDIGRMVVAPLLWKKRIKEVDYIVLSHPQRDHYEGLKFIAANFKPKEFWWNGDGKLPTDLKDILDSKGIKIIVAGGRTEPVEISGVKIEFIHPVKNEAFDVNNRSLVLRLTYGRRSFLFTGDIGAEAEEVITRKDVKADVLKVPHHGSKSSSTAPFIEKVSPAVAVASAGRDNPFADPRPETIRRYLERGIAFFRTDTQGAITIRTDGDGLKVEPYYSGR